MVFYFTIAFLLFSSSFLEIISNNKKISQTIFYIFIIFFYFISFIRWDTGTDWDSYYTMYNWIEVPWENFSEMGMEKGFTFINHLGKYLFNSYTGVLFLFSTIIYLSISKSYIILSQYPLTSLFISFCILSFAHILYVRQNIAVSIIGLSTFYIIKKNFPLFFLSVYIASLFHTTALVYLICYFIYYKDFSLKYNCILILGTLIIGTIVSKFLLSTLGSIGLGIISTKINNYLELGANDNSTTMSTTAIIIKGFINRFFILFLLFYCKYKLKYNSAFFNGLLNIYILGTVLYFTTLPLSVSLARIAVYMDCMQVFLIPYILYKQQTLINRSLLFILLAVYYFLRLYSSYISFESEYTPFTTIFET